MVSIDEAVLLLRGYRDGQDPLRVAVRSSTFEFSGFCTVHKVEDDAVSFWIGEGKDSAISFDLTDCLFDFRDVPLEESDAPLKRKSESCLGVVRRKDDFELLIMLLMC